MRLTLALAGALLLSGCQMLGMSGKEERAMPVAERGVPDSSPKHTAPKPGDQPVEQYAYWRFDAPHHRGFAHYLAEGYRRYSKQEDNEHDFEDAARFLARANAIEHGEMIGPETLLQRALPAYAVDDLIYARQRLTRMFDYGAREVLPIQTAAAQTAFDCWMEQQEENLQPHDVAKCRELFEREMARIEQHLVQRRPAEPVRTAEQVDPSLCDKPADTVLFDLDSHALRPGVPAQLTRVAQTLKQAPHLSLAISAHADRSGPDDRNMALSNRRLNAVVGGLTAAGVPRDAIVRAVPKGETEPRKPTPDGVREQANRRVELHYVCLGGV